MHSVGAPRDGLSEPRTRAGRTAPTTTGGVPPTTSSTTASRSSVPPMAGTGFRTPSKGCMPSTVPHDGGSQASGRRSPRSGPRSSPASIPHSTGTSPIRSIRRTLDGERTQNPRQTSTDRHAAPPDSRAHPPRRTRALSTEAADPPVRPHAAPAPRVPGSARPALKGHTDDNRAEGPSEAHHATIGS